MIDTKELREKITIKGLDVVADTDILEILDLLEAAEKSDAESLAMYRKARDERDTYKAAYNEWIDKTKWVQQGINEGTISPKYLGLHRADIMASLLGAAEKERDGLRAEVQTWQAQAKAYWSKIAEMERQEPVGVLHVGSYYGEELQDWEFEANQCACDKLNETPASAQKEKRMSNEFKREDRYIVFKISDIREALSTSELDDLKYMHRVVNACRERNGKTPLTCVVVEKDWPEYESTWQAIESRATGTQVPKEAIAKILTEVMDIAVSNGADSRSMPDEYVEVAAWLCGVPAQSVPSVPKKIERVESGFKGMFLREAQAYKRGWNECRGVMLFGESS